MVINLPDDHVIGFMIAVDKATKSAWPKPEQVNLDEVFIQDRF